MALNPPCVSEGAVCLNRASTVLMGVGLAKVSHLPTKRTRNSFISFKVNPESLALRMKVMSSMSRNQLKVLVTLIQTTGTVSLKLGRFMSSS